MGLSFLKILGILNILVFLGFMLFYRGNKNVIFVKFILLSFPFLNLQPFTNINDFTIITYLYFFVFYKKRNYSFSGSKFYGILILLFSITSLLGILLAPVNYDGENTIQFINGFPIFIFIKILIDNCFEDNNFLYTAINCLKITLFASFIFLMIQIPVGVNFSLSHTLNPNITTSSGFRYPSFLSDPQVYSQFLGALSFMSLILFKERKNNIKVNYLLLSFSILAILAAGGRAGFFGWGLGLVFLIMFSNASYRIALAFASSVLYIIAINFQDKFSIFNRGTDLNDTYDFRAGIWNDAIQIYLQHPIFGIGVGNYAKYVTLHNPDQVWLVNNELISFDHPESGYLKFLTEFGTIGFIIIFSLILIPMAKAFFVYLKTKDTNIILMISALICWFVGFYSTFSFGDIRIKIMIGAILGILIAYINIYNKKDDESEDIESELLIEPVS
jgi:O-antigen ligase